MTHVIRFEDGCLMYRAFHQSAEAVLEAGNRSNQIALHHPATNSFWIRFRVEHWNGTPEERFEGRGGALESRVRELWQTRPQSVLSQCNHLATFETRREAENMRHRMFDPTRFAVVEIDLEGVPEFYTRRDESFFTLSESV